MTKLWILNQDEQVQAVLSNKGTALSFFDSRHKEQVNGENTFVFSVPADHPDSVYIEEENIVLYRDLDGIWNPFVIREIDDDHSAGIFKTAFCEHQYTELIDHIVEDIRPNNQDASYMLQQILSGSRWQVGIVEVATLATTNFYYRNALDCIHEVVELCGGELRFRVEFSGNQITGRYVDLLVQRGNVTGKRFVFGKDTTRIKRKIDSRNIVTAIIGRGKGVENEEGTGYGRKLDFSDVVWSTENGDQVDKPAGQNWVGDPVALSQFGRPTPTGKIHRTRTYDFEDETDPETLLQKTWDKLQEMKNAIVSYELEVIDLEQAFGYNHENVRLGDTVVVIDKKFSPELRLKARVLEIERDLLNPENTKITLGNIINPFQDAERLHDVERDVFDKTTPTTWLDGIIDTIRNEVHGGAGTVKVSNDGLLILDKPEDQNPQKAILLNNGLLAIANSKVNGEWDWRTFITGDAVVADLIAAGTMLADRVRGGELYLGGIVNGVGKDGKLYLLNSEDEIVCQLDSNIQGFNKLFVGEISGNNVATKSFQNLTYYVNPSTGSDDNDGLSSGTSFKTLEKAIASMPEINQSSITINVAANSVLNESVTLAGKTGSGIITIDLNGSTLNGYIRIVSCNHRIYIQNGIISHTGEYPSFESLAYGCIFVFCSNWVTVRNMTLLANDRALACIYSEGGNLEVLDNSFYDAQDSLLYATTGGVIKAVDNVGSGSPYGMTAHTTGRISGYGTMPLGETNDTSAEAGGTISGTWQTPGQAGTKPTVPAQPNIKQWSSIDGASWEPTYGWDSESVRQGDPGDWMPEHGNFKGVWIFDSSDIRKTLSGKTIKSVRIKVKRETVGGFYTKIPVYLYTHDKTSVSGSEPTMIQHVETFQFEPGQEDWVVLPNSVGEGLRDGVVQGIGIYSVDTSQVLYLRMGKDAVLEITW